MVAKAERSRTNTRDVVVETFKFEKMPVTLQVGLMHIDDHC